MSSESKDIEDQLIWVNLRRELDYPTENQRDKMIRKMKENPLVPIGVTLTTAAITCGLYSFYSGNKKRSQLMMRARILAQGFTIGAIMVGCIVSQSKQESETKK